MEVKDNNEENINEEAAVNDLVFPSLPHPYSFCRNQFAGLLACRHVRQQANGL